MFLINKSDIIKNKDKENARNALLKHLRLIDHIPEDNISFFSGKSFVGLLGNFKKYIYNLEKNPFITLYDLFKNWYKNNIFNFKPFSEYINEIFDQLNEQFNLELDDEIDEIEIEVPKEFYNNIKVSINKLNKIISKKISN